MRLRVGDRAPVQAFTSIVGEQIEVGSGPLPIHVQFRRFAGCPVCDLHLRDFVRQADELARWVREVVVFHSTKEELQRHAHHLPLRLVADPHKALYRAFGVEDGACSLLDPRAWPAIVRSVSTALPDVLVGRRAMPPLRPVGGRFGLPADFLIDVGGRIIACQYGRHADDQWSVAELLSLVR